MKWQCDVQSTIFCADMGVGEIALIVGTVASTAVTGYTAYASSQAQSSASNYNAQVASQNATAATQQAEQNAEIQQTQTRQQLGSIVAGYGGSGIQSGSGSALDVLASSASSAEIDRRTILYKGELQALGYQDEASLDAAKSANDTTAGYLDVIGATAAGGSKIAAQFASPSGSPNTSSQSLLNNTPNAASLATPD